MALSREAWLLIILTVALMAAVGVRLPMVDTAAALLACVAAGFIWKMKGS